MMDMKGHTIALIGGFESGKTSFIKSVRAAVNGSPSGIPPAEEKPTLGIDEYNVPLPNGQSLTFLDTPGFDGYQAGDGHAKETEEILQMLEEHLAAKGTGLVSHVLFFMNANDMVPTEFKGRARRTFERLFANSKLACISTRWDQIENDDGLPVTAEEAKVKEESIYDMGRTSGSFLEYLFGGQVNNGDEVLRFRSGLPIEAYSSPQDIIHKLLPRSASEIALEERLSVMTKERDEIAVKYNLLLQEKGGPTVTIDDAAPVLEAATGAPRTRRQRLLDTIDMFSAQVLAMVADLDREALDVAEECKVNRAEFESASAAIEAAERRLAEETENVKLWAEECTRLQGERDALRRQEQSLTAELNVPQVAAKRSVIAKRLEVRLNRAQAALKDTESWIEITQADYKKDCQMVQEVEAEIWQLRGIKQAKESELNEWLSAESDWLTKEQETFRTHQKSVIAHLDIMRSGLKDGWEGTLGTNAVFLGGLGGYAVDPDMVARPGVWGPVIEPFYESQVAAALSKETIAYYSAVLQRLKIRDDAAQREWEKRVHEVFGQGVPPSNPLQPIPLSKSLMPEDLPPLPPPLKGHTSILWSAVFSGDGTKIISGSRDRTVRVWDALTGRERSVLGGHNDDVYSVALSEDESWIASGSGDKKIRLWKPSTGMVERVLEGHSERVRSLAFSRDGSRIISGSDDNTVRVWSGLTSGVCWQRVLTGHSSGVKGVAISGDGSRIISGSDDRTVRVWSALTGEVQRVLTGHSDCIKAVAISGDASRIISGSNDKTVRVWDAATGEVQRVLEGHTGWVWSLGLSKDGTRIVSGSGDSSVRVWDALTGKVQSVLKGHSGDVGSVAFSRDGRRIVSGADDNSIRVWDARLPAS